MIFDGKEFPVTGRRVTCIRRLFMKLIWVIPAIVAVGLPGLNHVYLCRETAAQDNVRSEEKVQNTGKAEKTELQKFMRGKLAMVQKIVEGLSTEDYELIQSGGRELLAISESATWKSVKDPFYAEYSENFEYSVKGMIEAAGSERLSRATFAYVHVTISCTACHQHVRGALRVAH